MKNILLILGLFLLNNTYAQIVENYWSYEGDQSRVYYEMIDSTSGQVHEEGTFIYGLRDGTWTRYWLNGNVQNVAYFNEGKKTGSWKFYDEEGKLTMLVKYKNDQLLLAEQRRYY